MQQHRQCLQLLAERDAARINRRKAKRRRNVGDRLLRLRAVPAKAEWLDGQAAILGSIGITHSFAGQSAEAIRYLIIREGEAHTLLARIDLAQDRLAEAMSNADRALTLHRRTGFRLGEARAPVVLGHDVPRHRTAASEIFAELGLPERV